MRPTVGIHGHCPPLCTYKELQDGTYTLADVQVFHNTMDEIVKTLS